MSDDRLHRTWLAGQLPALEAQSVIDAPTRARLAAWAAAASPSRSGLAPVISGVLGALLVGLGVVLLLAHNWEQWSRELRTVVSFGALALGQMLSAWVLWRRPASAAWRESAATAQCLGLGACIALIGQTWHLYGDLAGFLLLWMLLSLPLVYLLESTVVAVIACVAFTIWCWEAPDASAYPFLLALLVPFVVLALRRDRAGLRPAWLLWTLALCLVGALPALAGWAAIDNAWPFHYGALFAAFILADARWFDADRSPALRPLGVVGTLGAGVLLVMLASEDVLREWLRDGPVWAGSPADALLPAAALAAAVVLWLPVAARRDWRLAVAGALPLALWVAVPLPPDVALIWINAYAVAVALLWLRRGLNENRIGSLNLGLAILCGLIFSHFVVSDLPYTVRGVAFLAAGALFLGGNAWLRHRRLA